MQPRFSRHKSQRGLTRRLPPPLHKASMNQWQGTAGPILPTAGPISGKYKVIYPYDAKREDELVLRPGDVIDVEEQPGNWWRGRKVGFDPWKWFHKDFIAPEPLPEKDNKPVEREPTGQQVYYQGREYYADVQCEHLIKDAQCSVCLNLACNPCQTQCCGHTVCAECANTWKLQNDSCHHCRTPSCFWQTDVRIRRQIAGLTIYCAHYSSGCDWRGNIHRLQKHLNESCPIVVCQNEGCTEKVQRRYITEHMTKKCSQRFMKCPCCNQDSLNYQELISTHYRTCGNWPVRCPQNCSNGDLTRSTLKKHVASECSESVSPCPLVEYGCKVAVKRKDLHQHVHSHHNITSKSAINIIKSLLSLFLAVALMLGFLLVVVYYPWHVVLLLPLFCFIGVITSSRCNF